MFDCKLRIKAPLGEVQARLADIESLEYTRQGDWTLVEDSSGTQLFGWEVDAWLELAGNWELVYAYYDEDQNAEFVHIRDGVCLRAYQEYSGEVDTDEGSDSEYTISDWSDVADYLDEQ